MKLNILLTSMAVAAMSASAAVPSGYYDSLSGLNGSALRKAAKNVVRNHTVVSYGNSTWDAFESTDTRFVNGQNCWWDMYSPNNVLVSSGHPGMNIEHSVANSWWGGTKNDAYKDLFHLNPSNSDANSRKSNYPLGEVGSVTWTNEVTTVGKPVSGQGGGNNYVYEPCDEYKGDFARVFMYMFTVYDDIAWDSAKGWMFDKNSDEIFKPWAIELLLKWHRQDPVSEKEKNRNEAIYKIQRNRNPFIDSPELAEFIWGAYKNDKYEYGGEYKPVDPDDPTPPVIDPDDPEVPDDPDNPSKGDWILVKSLSQVTAEGSYILIGLGDKSNVVMTTEQKKTSSAAYLSPSVAVNVADGSLSDVPENAAVLKLEQSGADYVASVEDMRGNSLGVLVSTTAKNLLISETESKGTPFTLTIGDGKAEFAFDSKTGKIFYNESAPRFTTYTSTGQKPTALYRKVEETNAVEAIGGFEAGPVRIFNLQGIEMTEKAEDLQPGIYIFVGAGQAPRKMLISK